MNSSLDFVELAKIIELNSYTRNKTGVDNNADVFNQWMQALGFTVETHKREHIGNHVHYLSPKTDGTKILLLGHLDTVFPPDTFVDFREDDDWIYGPGVCDMKGGNYIALQALRNVYAEQGHISNIDMLLVSDEESGSDDSKLLTSQIAKDYDACMVFEAAGPDHDVVISRKGIATFQIEFEGKGAHAGNHYSDGINANLAAAHMLIALTNLTDLDKGTTVNAGKMKGGLGANTISPSASLTVEARFTQSEERDRVLAAFKTVTSQPAVAGVKVTVSGGLQRDVMQPSPAQAEFIAQLESILGTPLKLEKRGGVSDANVVSAAGVPTLDGFGPYGDGDHTIHERASKASFSRRIGEVTKILAHFNG
jgi:glutamate carboxypeptidase